MRGWINRWNILRRIKALGEQTPEAVLAWACAGALGSLGCMTNGHAAIYKLNVHGGGFLPIPKPRRTARSKLRRKLLRSVGRRLKWLDSDAE